MHNFFYKKIYFILILINTEVILFPLLKEKKYFIYNKNIFYDNWIKEKSKNLIQYILPAENIENIQKINS